MRVAQILDPWTLIATGSAPKGSIVTIAALIQGEDFEPPSIVPQARARVTTNAGLYVVLTAVESYPGTPPVEVGNIVFPG